MTSEHPYPRSRDWYERALRTAPGAVHSHFRMMEQPHPLFFRRGRGALLIDEDGTTYIDYALGQGPNILGHAHPRWLEAVRSALQEGSIFGAQHRREVLLAERICALVPCADMVRLGCTGSEAVHMAIRLARAVTGRRLVVRFEGHYHGWFDDLAVGISLNQGRAPWSAGQQVPSESELAVLPWNDADALSALFAESGDQVAAVIMEPVMCNTGCIEPLPDYLQTVRRLCDRHRAVLIFDEVITGFRLGAGGAQERYGIVPDLATFGKAVAGGFPLSVLAGRRELMEYLGPAGDTVHAGTFNSSVPATAAALATLEILTEPGTYNHLTQLGRRLQSGLTAAAGSGFNVCGPGPIVHLGFRKRDGKVGSPVHHAGAFHRAYDVECGTRFAALALQQGVRLLRRGVCYMSLAHTEELIERTVTALTKVLNQPQFSQR